MEKFLQDIDSDVSSISSSRSGSFASDSTLVNVGSLPTKAKTSIGQILVYGIKRRKVTKRLQVIKGHIEDQFIPSDMYDDLLEFQR